MTDFRISKKYDLSYLFPVDKLTRHMPDSFEILLIERRHFYNGKASYVKKGFLKYNGKVWIDTKAASYKCGSIVKGKENFGKCIINYYNRCI